MENKIFYNVVNSRNELQAVQERLQELLKTVSAENQDQFNSKFFLLMALPNVKEAIAYCDKIIAQIPVEQQS